MDNRIRTEGWAVHLSSKDRPDEIIKVSRGEESIFICRFFLAIVELAMDKGVDAYRWVKHLYIDDPISSPGMSTTPLLWRAI